MHFCFMLYEYQLYKIYRTISDRVMPDKIMWYFTVTCVRYVLRIVDSESIFKACQHHDFKTTSWKQAQTEGSLGKCGRSKDEMSEARLVSRLWRKQSVGPAWTSIIWLSQNYLFRIVTVGGLASTLAQLRALSVLRSRLVFFFVRGEFLPWKFHRRRYRRQSYTGPFWEMRMWNGSGNVTYM